MDFDYKKLEQEAKKLGNIYGWAKSKSAKERIANDLMIFNELYSDFSLLGNNLKWEEDNDIIEASVTRHNKHFNEFILNLANNISFYKDTSKKILQTYKNSNFDIYGSYKHGDFKKVNEKDAQESLKAFFADLGDKYYNLYKKINEENQIIMPYAFDLECIGTAIDINILNKTYITCAYKNYSVPSLAALAHEIGHSYDNEILYNHNKSQLFSNIFYEIPSSFFEYLYTEFLIKNHIFKKEALHYKQYLLENVFGYSFDINFLANNKEINIDENYNLIITDDSQKNIYDKLNEKYNCSYKLTDNINVRDTLIYGYGKYFSIIMNELYQNDKKTFLKKFDNFMFDYQIGGNLEILTKLGITDEELTSNKVLKKTLNKQASDLRKN